jgi:hypothetical protein
MPHPGPARAPEMRQMSSPSRAYGPNNVMVYRFVRT